MRAADISPVERIEQHTLSPWKASSLVSELEQERGIVLVAEQDVAKTISPASVIGWCACRYLTPEAELLKIAVDHNARNKGVATTLLEILIRTLYQKHVQTLFLEVRSQNQSAINLYKKSGFIQTGMRRAYYSHPADNALLFQKSL